MPPTWIDRGDNYPDPGGISLGAVVGNQKVASKALAVPVAEAQQHVAEAPAKHADETSCAHRAGHSATATAQRPRVRARRLRGSAPRHYAALAVAAHRRSLNARVMPPAPPRACRA